jgi:hypothetical protein
MKDDEKRLLGLAEATGTVKEIQGMPHGRFENLKRKWMNMGWLDSDGKLTAKCLAKQRGIVPEVLPEPEPSRKARKRRSTTRAKPKLEEVELSDLVPFEPSDNKPKDDE